jgi:hypothetical protein
VYCASSCFEFFALLCWCMKAIGEIGIVPLIRPVSTDRMHFSNLLCAGNGHDLLSEEWPFSSNATESVNQARWSQTKQSGMRQDISKGSKTVRFNMCGAGRGS